MLSEHGNEREKFDRSLRQEYEREFGGLSGNRGVVCARQEWRDANSLASQFTSGDKCAAQCAVVYPVIEKEQRC